MASFKDQAQAIEESLKQILVLEDISHTEHEVIKSLHHHVNTLSGRGVVAKEYNQFTAQELSNIAGALAILKVSLGDLVATALKNFKIHSEDVDYQESAYRDIVTEELAKKYQSEPTLFDAANKPVKKKKSPTQKDIEAELIKRLYKTRVMLHLKEEHYLKLNNLFWSIHGLVSTLGRRVDLLMFENTHGKYMDSSTDLPPEENYRFNT